MTGGLRRGRVAIIQGSPNHLFDRHRILLDLCIPEPRRYILQRA